MPIQDSNPAVDSTRSSKSNPKSSKKHPKRGRPKIHKVDVVRLEKLARIGCTYDECADVLGVPSATLQKSYSEIYTKARENLKERLRRAQIKKALSGNVVMQIWLGKQYLGQKDKHDITSNDETIYEMTIGKTVQNPTT
jgi:hypothetical protein